MNNPQDFIMHYADKKVQKVMTIISNPANLGGPFINSVIVFTAPNPGTWEGMRWDLNMTKFAGDSSSNTIRWYIFLRKAGVPDPVNAGWTDGGPFSDNNTALIAAGVEILKSSQLILDFNALTLSTPVGINWAIQDGGTNTVGNFALNFVGTTTPPPPAPITNVGSIAQGPVIYNGAVTATTITTTDIPFAGGIGTNPCVKVKDFTSTKRRLHTGDQIVFTWASADTDVVFDAFCEGLITAFFKG